MLSRQEEVMRQAAPPPLAAVFAARRGRFAGATASAAAAVRRASLPTAEAPSASVDRDNSAAPRHEERPATASVVAAFAAARRASPSTAVASSARIGSDNEGQRHEEQPVSDVRVGSSINAENQRRHDDEEGTSDDQREEKEEQKEDVVMESGGGHEDSGVIEEQDVRVGNGDVRISNSDEAHEVESNDANQLDALSNEAMVYNRDVVNNNNSNDEDGDDNEDNGGECDDDKEGDEQNNTVERDDRSDEEGDSDDDAVRYNEEDITMDHAGARTGSFTGAAGAAAVRHDGDDDDDDDDAPITGTTMVSESFPARFASWEELEDYIDELGATTFQLFHKRSSLSVGHRHAMVENSKLKKGKPIDKVNDPDFIPFDWIAYNRVYSCTCGFRNLRRGQGIRNHVVVRGTGCKVKITAAVTYDRDTGVYYLKTKLKGVHNHPCDRDRYYSYAENRRFEPVLLREMAAMDTLGSKAREILNYATEYMWNKTGMKMVYKMSDVRNALRRYRKHAAAAASTGGNTEASEPAERNDEDEAECDQQEPQQQEPAPVRRVMPGDNLNSEDESEPSADTRTENLSWMPTAVSTRTETSSGDGEQQQQNQRKRRADAIAEAQFTVENEAFNTVAGNRGLQKVTLSQLKVLMDSHYSYALAHEDVSPMRAQSAVCMRLILTTISMVCRLSKLSSQVRSVRSRPSLGSRAMCLCCRRISSLTTWSSCCRDTPSLAVKRRSLTRVALGSCCRRRSA